MADSIENALQEAIDELLTKELVLAVSYQERSEAEEWSPCGFVSKLLNVKHLVGDGSTFSSKLVYIKNEAPFNWDWHYGGPKLEADDNSFETLLKSKLASVKTTLDLDFIEIQNIDLKNKSAIVFAVKGTTGNNADTFTIKVWKKTATTVGYKIINKTIVE